MLHGCVKGVSRSGGRGGYSHRQIDLIGPPVPLLEPRSPVPPANRKILHFAKMVCPGAAFTALRVGPAALVPNDASGATGAEAAVLPARQSRVDNCGADGSKRSAGFCKIIGPRSSPPAFCPPTSPATHPGCGSGSRPWWGRGSDRKNAIGDRRRADNGGLVGTALALAASARNFGSSLAGRRSYRRKPRNWPGSSSHARSKQCPPGSFYPM
jgi:hypothetical protein